MSDSVTSTRMPVVPLKVRYKDGSVVQTYGFIDSGSSISFCNYDRLRQLGVGTPRKTQLTLTKMTRNPIMLHTSAVSDL